MIITKNDPTKNETLGLILSEFSRYQEHLQSLTIGVRTISLIYNGKEQKRQSPC
jgi:hypothetical protein